MNLHLDGKVALVAGSSRGIGLGIARAFLREGAHVILTGRNPEALEIARNRLLEESTGSQRVTALAGDLTEPAVIETVFNQAVREFGVVDAVVANLGSGKGERGYTAPPTEWLRLVNLNLFASMALARVALGHMLPRRTGTLLFISSIAGLESVGAPVPYAAAKAAIIAAAKEFAREAGPAGVRVNVLAPGNILFPGGSWEGKLRENPAIMDTVIKTQVALQRLGTPEEIGDLAVFLASPRAAFITGACVVADGGQTRAFA